MGSEVSEVTLQTDVDSCFCWLFMKCSTRSSRQGASVCHPSFEGCCSWSNFRNKMIMMIIYYLLGPERRLRARQEVEDVFSAVKVLWPLHNTTYWRKSPAFKILLHKKYWSIISKMYLKYQKYMLFREKTTLVVFY